MRATALPHLARLALTLAAIAAVTGVVYALDRVAPVLSLGALYLFAVVPVAVLLGLPYAISASVLSMLTFNFLFLPPLYTFTLADTQNWVALAIYLVTAIVVSELAARLRHRAADAEQREREEAILAELATIFLTGRNVTNELGAIAERAGKVLGAEHARIELGPEREPPPGQSPYDLRAGEQHVGTLYLEEGPASNLAVRRRFLPALASLLAVAIERERLAEEALEAEALRRSDTIKTAVLRAVSHDLQSPLTAIITAAGSLASDELSLDPEDREDLVDAIQVEAARLERLVRDLLDLSRLEAGAAQPLLELWTVDELVSQALEDLGPASERVDVAIPADVPPVRVDAGQVRRALGNLLENAVKFSPAGEQVSVRATATRKEVIVRVVDRGPGLSPEEAQHAFEPFFRGAVPTGTRGSGLGLAIVRGFAEANGGRVWVESRPGQGSSFAIAFEAVPTLEPALMEQ